MIRIALSLFAGVAIALALFWAMHYMISNNQQGLKKTSDVRMVDFIRFKRETKIQSKDRLVPEKPKPRERPVQPKLKVYSAQVKQTDIPDMDMPNLDIPIQNSSFGSSVLTGLQVGKGQISTHVIPLVRIQPTYPMRAANRRIEGWVKVEFTITKEGTVKDAVVVASQPSSIFNRAALKAIKRWKFKPHIVAGEAVEQRAAQILKFDLKK
ncbi:MAG: TonB family protein [Gammaproteobacteria bacterium]|nr:TonB family protein [Gammaproteobacteria bacterium]MBT4146041.1 TonB family protein [Gammaproteobacteria bacterium]MBT5222732.1 TonB family protein [Gammaproteobacteria bacterium]MBT5827119.1 TonB family protein [Gammaproteobacteria bacterium]MBT6420364.1 TonB family protein [Gammaproteobacteria bacterium]